MPYELELLCFWKRWGSILVAVCLLFVCVVCCSGGGAAGSLY